MVSCFVKGALDCGDSGKSTAPIITTDCGDSDDSAAPIITRDLLKVCCTIESKDLDLDLQVPCGWEKRLDVKSGEVYLQRSNSSTTNSKIKFDIFPDLSVTPKSLTLYDDSLLDLKLASSPSCSTSHSSSTFQSVCTLDKVKSALERAEKDSIRKRLSSSPLSTSSSSVDCVDEEERSSGVFAVGCPSCFLYVLVKKHSPKCPHCNCVVSLPGATKKPRIDLNMSI